MRRDTSAGVAHATPPVYLRRADARLKVFFLPWLLHRLIRRLGVYWDTEPLLNTSATMLMGVLIVIFSFGLAQPIAALASTATRNASASPLR